MTAPAPEPAAQARAEVGRMEEMMGEKLTQELLVARMKAAKNQDEAAVMYCDHVLMCVPPFPFLDVAGVNRAIKERWPKGLERVKRKAWKKYEEPGYREWRQAFYVEHGV